MSKIILRSQDVIRQTIRTRLIKLRTEKGVEQSKVALMTGIQRSSISRYECGISMPGIMQLVLLADYYHCTLDYLVGRTNRRTKRLRRN